MWVEPLSWKSLLSSFSERREMNTASLWLSLLQVTICSANYMFSKPTPSVGAKGFQTNTGDGLQPWQVTRTPYFWQEDNSGATRNFSQGLYCSFPLEGHSPREPMRAQAACGTWALVFEVTASCRLIFQFDSPFKRGNMEPGCTHTLTRLPEASQIRKVKSCLKGPPEGGGDGAVGAGREKAQQRGDTNSSPQAQPLNISSPKHCKVIKLTYFIPALQRMQIHGKRKFGNTNLHCGRHEIFIWDSEGWSHLVC